MSDASQTKHLAAATPEVTNAAEDVTSLKGGSAAPSAMAHPLLPASSDRTAGAPHEPSTLSGACHYAASADSWMLPVATTIPFPPCRRLPTDLSLTALTVAPQL